MTTRRTGLLTALLLTAALLLGMPGLLRSFVHEDLNRMNERLRPARQRTLTVWLLPGDMEDREVVTRACAAFEKRSAGVRVFLRVVDVSELYAADAVLPDVALFETGAVAMPEAVFLPLAQEADSSGMSGGVRYALPLWMHVNVLSLPQSWFGGESHAQRQPASLLAAASPVPQREMPSVLAPEEVPWSKLLAPGALEKPRGVALQQLLMSCPEGMRQALLGAFRPKPSDTPAPTPTGWETTRPLSRGPTATPAADVSEPARVRTLKEHLRSVRNGSALCACVLAPAVSDQVRYAALCRDGEDARTFLRFLLDSSDALSLGYLPAREAQSAEPLAQAAVEQYETLILPNAFSHTRQELLSLCRDAFERGEDPVATLLRLR